MSTAGAGGFITDGRFFRTAGRKFYPRGVVYGPFAPNASGEPFPSPQQAVRDLVQIRELGVNLLRLYEVPPLWFLNLADEQELRLLIDIPWNKEVCFLDAPALREGARKAVCQAARQCGQHPAVFALSVVNEVRPDIVRWSGAKRVAAFIDELVAEVKSAAPGCLCTFGNYPPTEFLRPRDIDFHCFNVYLHQPQAFANYLARLQMIAESRPLMLGEVGMDSRREGEAAQAQFLGTQIELAFRGGLAGVVVFSYTDDWCRDSRPVQDWAFGLTTKDRVPRPSFQAVKQRFHQAPNFPPSRYPKVSVVVACYNGARTLKLCLESLSQLHYPDYEVILVDDGSTDNTGPIAQEFPHVRCVRHPQNLGLSEARNSGIAAAQGEIIAFTDADCRADEDWLFYLVSDLERGCYAGIGGPNLLPPDDSCVASAVMASPGGPAHVMLTDRLAEHIPGCNMGFYKWALQEVGGFDPQFRTAGDDVDICWRLQQAGLEIGFSPSAFVWHYRRSRVQDYLRQQYGYGEAEALLVRKHPEFFNEIGGGLWRGRIYSHAHYHLIIRPPRIYYGPFASGFFQSLYTMPPAAGLMLFTSLEYHVLVTLPLCAAALVLRGVLPFALLSLILTIAVCIMAAVQTQIARKKRRFWSRPLVAWLFLLQPIIRGYARYQGRLMQGPLPLKQQENLETLARATQTAPENEAHFWVPTGLSRIGFVNRLTDRLKEAGWQFKTDTGWTDYDVEITGDRWSRLQILTAAEFYPGGQQGFRCRMRRRWSLLARLGLAFLVGLELLFMGLFCGWQDLPRLMVGTGLILCTTTALCWFFQHRVHSLHRILGVFLEKTAEAAGLIRIPSKARPPEDPAAENQRTSASVVH